MNFKLTIVAAIWVVSQCLLISGASAGTTVWTFGNIRMTDDNGTDHTITIYATEANQITLYDTDDTSDADHHTSASPPHYYKHFAVPPLTSGLWVNNAKDPNDNSTQHVTAASLKRYWDKYYNNLDANYVYSGGASGSSEDSTYNCHAYAMNQYDTKLYNTWINEMGYIDTDDLADSVNGWKDTTILRNGNDHSIAVTSIAIMAPEGMDSTIKTAEKNQAGGIYLNTWSDAGPAGAATKRKHQ
jgi:hypothetical protein